MRGVILYDWLGLLIWRSLIGPALETGPKIRDADRSGLLAAVVVVWLPRVVCSSLWVRVLLSYAAWLLSVCIFRVSMNT